MLAGDFSSLGRSDKITLKGKIQSGFGDYMIFLYRPSVINIQKPDPPDFAEQIRRKFSSALRLAINDDAESNLALGYLVGEKGKMSDSLNTALKNVGLSHVVVASGFHLGVLIDFAKKYLKKISRFAALLGSVILIFAFLAVTGFSPSLARAGIISILSLLAWYFGRKFHPVRIILFTAALTLILRPSYLQDIAWQFSFLSYLGITVVSPIIESYLFGEKKPNFISSSVIQSLSAQLLCLPVMIVNFGSFSIMGVLANLVISPTIAIIMGLCAATGLVSIFSRLAVIMAIPAKLLLRLHIAIIEGLNSIPWSRMELNGSPIWFLAYPAILVIVILIIKRIGFSFRPAPLLEKSQKNGKIYAC